MRRGHRTRAVVFDLDGTLIDSLPVVLRAIAHALEPFGPRPTMEIFAKLGGPPERFLATLLDDVRDVPTAMQRMHAFHQEHGTDIEPFAGVPDFLGGFRGAGAELGIWTGRDRESTVQLLRKLKLEGFFSTVVCGDDLPTHKPDPEGLREVMRRMGIPFHETIFVGDADVDVLGGVACRVDTVLIRHQRQVAESTLRQSWQHVASPREALELVRRCVESSVSE
jgi:HAD superfamily hydrolase (TIGR01549 family)